MAWTKVQLPVVHGTKKISGSRHLFGNVCCAPVMNSSFLVNTDTMPPNSIYPFIFFLFCTHNSLRNFAYLGICFMASRSEMSSRMVSCLEVAFSIVVIVGTMTLGIADSTANDHLDLESNNRVSTQTVVPTPDSRVHSRQPTAELKPLPEHLKYAYLEDDQKLPIIIAKLPKSIGWSLADLPGINPSICMHKILLEEEARLVGQPQRQLNPTILDVVKKGSHEATCRRIIYPHLKQSVDYKKLNQATRKDHFPLPFIDQVLERLAGKSHYCFLDDFLGFILHRKINTRPPSLIGLAHLPTLGCRLKKRLTTTPILQAPNWELPFKLMCDTSNLALRAIVIFSDHAALKFLLKKPNAKPRLICWMLLLQEFDIEIRDKNGAENLVADHLSRIEKRIDLLPIRDDFPDEQLMQLEGIDNLCVVVALLNKTRANYSIVQP
ncbi:hypothetical protein CR513_02828, partial [Mucuna pruriens]